MPRQEVAFLGPPGTYSHLVAEKRYGRNCRFIPLPTILEVCSFVARNPGRRGIVPIENSSGGVIDETIDILLENRPPVHILEELSLEVRLALLGYSKDVKINSLYSHFVPLEHCDPWIRRRLPKVRRQVVASTAVAAQMAAADASAAAIGNRKLAGMYGLKILEFPIGADVPNQTLFIAIGGSERIQAGATKTTLAVRLPNEPGSLCTFLEAFRDHNVNLSRIESRPIRGCPRQYAFLVDIAGSVALPMVQKALKRAKKTAVQIRVVGSYPCRRPYKS